MRRIIAIFLVLSSVVNLVSCSDNDDPQPKLQPGEIPMIETEPAEYVGEEYLRHDTVPVAWTGGPVLFIPQISVKQAGDEKTELVSQYENEFYFTSLSGELEYRIGDMLPRTVNQTPIGHVVDVYALGDTDFPSLVLGYFGVDTDDCIILNWPQKNLKVYLRIYFKAEYITLPENWHGLGDQLGDNLNATVNIYGMYVNGVPVSGHQLKIVLQPDGSVKLFGRPDALKL